MVFLTFIKKILVILAKYLFFISFTIKNYANITTGFLELIIKKLIIIKENQPFTNHEWQ